MASLAAILKSLGASPRRDGTMALDCLSLQLNSIFGGDLEGDAVVVVAADAVSFKSPPELAACGKLWMPEVKDADALCQAIGVALDDVRNQARAALATLRRLGFQSTMVAPDPRAHGHMQVGGVDVGVVVDNNGDLVVVSVDGRALAPEERRSMMAPEEATPAEAKELCTSMAKAYRGGATGAQAPSLSQEELNELQMALSDDDSDEADAFSDDDDDDNEKTAAGVPPPSRASRPAAPMAPDVDDDVGTLKLEFNAKDELEKARQAKEAAAARPSSGILDEFDDDFDGDGDVEPTATRPKAARMGAPTIVPKAPMHDDVSDSDEDDALLAGLGADERKDMGAFPAFDDDAAPFSASPTAVSDLPMPSAAPTAAHPRPGVELAFEEETTGAAQKIQATDNDDFDDGKTKALVVDEALLARLKLGDAGLGTSRASPPPGASREGPFELPPTSTAAAMQGMGPAIDDGGLEADDHGFDDDDEVEPTNTSAPPAPLARAPLPPPRHEVDSNDLDASGFDDDDAVSDPVGADVRVDASGGLADEFGEDEPFPAGGPFGELPEGKELGDDDVGDDVGVGAPIALDADDEAELLRLRGRRAALMDEVALIDARLAELARGLETTGSSTATARSSRLATEARPQAASPAPLRPADREPPRVGDSAEDSGEGDTAGAGNGFTSLPSLQSVDVHEVLGSRGGSQSLMDALDGDDDELPPADGGGFDGDDDSSEAPTQAVPVLSAQDRQARVAAKAAEDAALAAALAAVDDEADEEGVSLADLQGALQEMGVDLGEGGATQVAASVMPFALKDDGDGDVFGSVSGADSLEANVKSEAGASDMSEEATRIRTGRPSSSIALVVEDARARERLRKHLVDRFSGLIEANNGRAAMQLKGIADVDAIVFVRPSQDDTNLASFTRLGGLPHRPRVLVISHDATFDALPAVDLRLPLGQRASEVAQQVLDGLERLGIQLNPGA